MEPNRIQSPQEVISNLSVRHAIKKAESERNAEIKKWNEKGFKSPESYAHFLNEQDLKRTDFSNQVMKLRAENSKKKIEAREKELETWQEKGYKSKEDYALNLYAQDKKQIKEQQQKQKEKSKKGKIAAVAGAGVLGALVYSYFKYGKAPEKDVIPEVPINPNLPLNPDINPDDFEEVIKNPTYQEKVNDLTQNAQNQIIDANNNAKAQIEVVYNNIDKTLDMSSVSEIDVFNSHTVKIGYNDLTFNRDAGDSLITWMMKAKEEASQMLEENKKEYVQQFSESYPDVQTIFDKNNVEFSYDNIDILDEYPFVRSRFPDCYETRTSYELVKEIPIPNGYSEEFINKLSAGYAPLDVVESLGDGVFDEYPRIENLFAEYGYEKNAENLKDAIYYINRYFEIYPGYEDCYEAQQHWVKIKELPMQDFFDEMDVYFEEHGGKELFFPNGSRNESVFGDINTCEGAIKSFDERVNTYLNALPESDKQAVLDYINQVDTIKSNLDTTTDSIWNKYIQDVMDLQNSMTNGRSLGDMIMGSQVDVNGAFVQNDGDYVNPVQIDASSVDVNSALSSIDPVDAVSSGISPEVGMVILGVAAAGVVGAFAAHKLSKSKAEKAEKAEKVEPKQEMGM